MKQIVIRCADLKDPGELWERYIGATQPEGSHLFGRNLDAFWDAIAGVGPGWPGKDVELVFRDSSALARMTSGSGKTYLEHFQEFARDQADVRITLV